MALISRSKRSTEFMMEKFRMKSSKVSIFESKLWKFKHINLYASIYPFIFYITYSIKLQEEPVIYTAVSFGYSLCSTYFSILKIKTKIKIEKKNTLQHETISDTTSALSGSIQIKTTLRTDGTEKVSHWDFKTQGYELVESHVILLIKYQKDIKP